LGSFSELASIALENGRLHNALQLGEQRIRAMIDALPDSIIQFHISGSLITYKQGKDSELPVENSADAPRQLADLLPPDIVAQFLQNAHRAIRSGRTQVFEYALSQDERIEYWETRILPSGREELIAIARDITERKAMENQLQYIGLHDQLTGLYSRFYFEEEMRRLDESRQFPVAIIVCDIDGLKLVNDTLGHQVGDELLISAANIICSCFDDKAVIARIGGDEFAIILPGKDIKAAEAAYHKIGSILEEYRIPSIPIPLNISVGVSVRTDGDQPMTAVFKAADNNMYREKLHSTYSARSAIVQTLAKALEARDFATVGHADRLQDLIVELALAAGEPENTLSDLRLLGRFHDIGKVGIPDYILFKPGRLTDTEYEIMKRHAEIGYRIAQSSAELAPIADWILNHQEWWNGKGYPLGLAGENIPRPARLLAVVDAYDAMTNDRPYRKALSKEKALAELRKCAGTQFDPQLVDIFTTQVIGGEKSG
jgi:diguanylate cyclase (GGDEF)-like protein